MLRRTIRLSLRGLRRQRTNAIINIGGLAFSMTVAMLIGIWIYDELSFDHIHPDHDRIAKVRQNLFVNGDILTDKQVPLPLADELANNYGKYFDHIVRSSNRFPHLMDANEKKQMVHGVFLDAAGPEMLGLEMIAGSQQGLNSPDGLLISASTAKAFFGDENPINKIYGLDNSMQVKVTGVYRDLPPNSTFASVKFIAPFALYLQQEKWISRLAQTWHKSPVQLYVQVSKAYEVEQVSAIIRNIIPAKSGIRSTTPIEGTAPSVQQPTLLLEPMNNWHLYADFKNGQAAGGKISYVWMFGAIGIFVLLLACVNFMNLTTARSVKHARDTGIRKTIGASRIHLIKKFYIDSFVVVMVSFVAAILLVKIFLPLFNEVAAKTISFPLQQYWFWLSCAAFVVLITIIAGSYPALYLSAFRPIKVLKGNLVPGKRAGNLRRYLVVFQFTISLTLIICTVIISRQIEYGKNRDAGFESDRLVQLYLPTKEITSHFSALENELKASGAVETIALSESTATDIWGTATDLDWPGKDPGLSVNMPVTAVSTGYGGALGWKFLDGRDFSKDFRSDSAGMILTESAARYMALSEPVGQRITWNGRPYAVIGVIKDIIIESPFKPARPSIYALRENEGNYLFMKLASGPSSAAALRRIEPIVKKFNSDQPFDYRFVAEEYNNKFSAELRINRLGNVFAALAILVSLLGLFGLTSFVAEQRSREISVRKVLGASVLQLWTMLTSGFVGLVLVSCIIAVPLSWMIARNWLQQFEYRTMLKWYYFAMPLSGALLITILVVCVKTLQSATANPVKNLNAE